MSDILGKMRKTHHCNALGNYGLYHKKITRDYDRALFYLERAAAVADTTESERSPEDDLYDDPARTND